LFFFNADMIQDVLNNHLNQEIWKRKYNIAYFWWELETFPDKFINSFNDLSEVWVGTDFCQKSISKISPVPVVKIPWKPTLVKGQKNWKRSDFGIDSNTYVYLFVYDSGHYPQRKNPLALVKSFVKASLPKDKSMLIIKAMHFDCTTEYNKQLLNLVRKSPNIKLITDDYTRDKTLGLIKCSDCYVSPHRSEGFGATIMEAMSMGIPVIVTSYGGSMDFTQSNNSYLVDYDLVRLKENIGPYDKNCVWAEPLVEDLAKNIRNVFLHPKIAKKIGLKGKLFVEAHYGREVLSSIINERMRFIKMKIL
jgi:glycosyltransferase involved in cell wall biosynthesis